MATVAKNLNTRIALKYDSYENWQTYNPILLKGEIAIAELPVSENKAGVGEPNAEGSTPAIQNAPNILIKVGDGTNHYNDLKFVSALAADVYSWAKAATKPEYTANEIKGLDSFIGNQIQDTNTQYRIVAVADAAYSYKLQKKDIGDADYSDVAGSVINLVDVDARLDVLEAAIAQGGSVDTKITNAIDALDYTGKASEATTQGKFVTDVTETNGIISVTAVDLTAADIPQLEQSKINGLETALAGKQNVVPFENDPSNDDKVATVKSITDRIGALDHIDASDATSAEKIVAEVTQADGVVTVKKVAVADILPDYEDTANGFVVAVNQTDGKINVSHAAVTDVLSFAGNYNGAENPIATRDYVTEAVADLNGAMHFRGTVDADPTVTAPTGTYKAGDVVLFGYDEYVYDGTKWVALGNESIYAKDADVDAEFAAVRQELANEKLALQGEIDSDIAAARTEITKEIGDKIATLDYEGKGNQGKFVTDVTETDGIISVTAVNLVASDIPVIAQSQVDGLEAALEGKQSVVPFEYTPSNDDKVATVKSVTERIGALDYSIAEEDNKVVSAFTVTDGVLEANSVKKVTLAKVATTGKVEDIEQDGLVIINCGTANTNIAASDAAAIAIP